jgi:hypothetical protein
MTIRKWARLAALSALLATTVSSAASAAAMVDVTARWNVRFRAFLIHDPFTPGLPLPAGIDIFCGDLASINCSDSAGLHVSKDTEGVENFSVFSEQIFRIVNNSQSTFPLSFLVFDTDFTAFHNGGGGATVNDPATERAAYTSMVEGLGVGDQHGCDTAIPNEEFFTPFHCGVHSPDSSQDVLFIPIPEPGKDVSFTYNIALTARLEKIPEPMTLSVFGAGLAGVAALRRRNKART